MGIVFLGGNHNNFKTCCTQIKTIDDRAAAGQALAFLIAGGHKRIGIIGGLPSPCGIGTLGEAAYRFVDFLAESGPKYWQMLPIGPPALETVLIRASPPLPAIPISSIRSCWRRTAF